MPLEHREELARITNFTDLVSYLHERMDWPIETTDFDDLTFEYTADELGIDAKNAAKISEIRRLRPLVAHQPWGIFFVQFERKRLPVVALRRMLAQLVFKKRASAGRDERPTWDLHDLLFISAFGTPDEPRICFAHFSEDELVPNQATLKVLNWDEHDTGLKLDHVVGQLTQKLAWPDDENDMDAWRSQWRAAFTLRHRQVITTSRDLAIKLATLARSIRALILATLEIETETGKHRRLLEDFRRSLIHDLDEDGFADMYAQTITYGLLSARVSRQSGALVADDAALLVPETNPFLRELMENFLKLGGRTRKSNGHVVDFDELGINEVIETLRDANMEAVLRDFGDKNPQEDPVIHFYELFLKEYDAKKRMQRGVYYTPRPVVSYIVRSVDELLRTEFGLTDGLADTATWADMAKRHKDIQIPEGVDPQQDFVQILDPATGTGTFLVEVIGHIHKTLVDKWRVEGHSDKKIDALWNDYVPRHLLPRLHGYELMMAPYAIAHLKIGLKLHETGYKFQSHERARIYLTNALEPAHDFDSHFDFDIPALAHEAEAVNHIKCERRFTVVIGNPPYAGISSNMTPWADGLLKGKLPDGTETESYYRVNGEPLGEKKVWLQDDYVKFIRYGQWTIETTRCGFLGFITNHGYLDNPTFRGMRWSLMTTFDKIRVMDLHGNSKKKESAPGGGKDVNVFEIQQGVSIGLFSRTKSHPASGDLASVWHADLWGERERKYNWLVDTTIGATVWRELSTTEPFYLFEPFDQSEVGDYYDWPAINAAIPVNATGIVTARDHFVIDYDRDALAQRISELRDTAASDEQIRTRYFTGKGSSKYPPGDSRGWKLPSARKRLREDADWEKRYVPILYRPFDTRVIYFVPWMVDWPRPEAMPHMLAGENFALAICRQSIGDSWQHSFVTNEIMDDSMVSNRTRERGYLHPLYIYPGIGKTDATMFSPWPEGKGGRRPNLDPNFVAAYETITEMTFDSDGRGDLTADFGPEDLLAYIYAVFHCPEYRRRFEPMLKLDFPRVPPPANAAHFTALARLGQELLALHLLESPVLETPITLYVGKDTPEVDKITYTPQDGGTVWLDKKQTIGFHGVPEAVWSFHIGGYQVCHKWLKDRKGRTLTPDDIAHYQKIVVALHETIRLMQEIEVVIERHGGWPAPPAGTTTPMALPAG